MALEVEKEGRIYTTLPEGVKITQVTADGTGVVYGLGNDQKMYVWHHSLELKGNWVLHVVNQAPEKPVKDTKEKKK